MVLPIPRYHFFEINDQPWYTVRLLPKTPRLTTNPQVPPFLPHQSPSRPHAPVDPPPSNYPTRLPLNPRRPHVTPHPRQDHKFLHLRRLLFRRRRADA